MQLLYLLTMGVLIGVSAADVDCYKEKFSTCSKNILQDNKSNEDNTFCGGKQKGITQCQTESAVGCNMTFIAEAEMVQQVMVEVCKEGSNINMEMKNNVKCIETGITGNECTKQLLDLTKGGSTQGTVLNFLKEACRLSDKIHQCQADKVKDKCGSDVYKLYRRVFSPVVEHTKKVCEEVVFPEEEVEGSGKKAKIDLPIFFGMM